MELEDQFTEELHGTYEAACERGYGAIYFLQMLEEYGGVQTANVLKEKYI
jgi:hypothetical protein